MKTIILFFLLLPFFLLGQTPTPGWQKTFGGSEIDFLTHCITTSDNGLLLTGYSYSNISGDKTENSRGSADIWVIKLDAQKNTVWQKTIGGNDDDSVSSVIETTDGYVLGGSSNSNISGEKTENSRGESDIWVIKLNFSGTILWQKTIGGVGLDFTSEMDKTLDNGIIIGAYTFLSGISGEKTAPDYGDVDYWVLKLDALGNIVWQKTYGGSGEDVLYSIKHTPDGGYIMCGDSISPISGVKTEGANGWDYWVIKTDALGNIQWQNTIGGTNADSWPYLLVTSNNDYLIAGSSRSSVSGDKTVSNYGDRDFWIVKLDAAGNIIWDKCFGGNDSQEVKALIETPDNNYILGGWSTSPISGTKTENSRGIRDYWLIKINQNGTLLWDKTIGGTDADQITSLSLKDNNLIAGGTSRSSITGDKTENTRGNIDYWLVELENINLNNEAFQKPNVILYPNPTANGIVNIDLAGFYNKATVKVHNTIGQTVFEKEYYSTSSITDNFLKQSGVYFFTIDIDDKTKTCFKVIFE